MGVLDARVYFKVIVFDDHLLLPVILLFLFELFHFFDHIFTRDENGLEVSCVRERILAPNFVGKDRFSFIFGVVLLT